MKKILILTIAFLVLCSATQSYASGEPVPMFTLDHEWTWKNLTYGPLEMLSSPIFLIIGPVAGVNGGIEYFNKEEDTAFTRTMKSTGGAITGLFIGFLAAPAVLLKGGADTLTGGAFTSGAFFN